jgi:hypothetical protein
MRNKLSVIAGCLVALIVGGAALFFYGEPGLLGWYFPKTGRAFHNAGIPLKNNQFYSDTALTASPSWDPTLPPPITPDKAAIAAIAFANSTRPQPLPWQVDQIEIELRQSKWFYSVDLVDRQSASAELEIVRVLMNGQIWTPDPP